MCMAMMVLALKATVFSGSLVSFVSLNSPGLQVPCSQSISYFKAILIFWLHTCFWSIWTCLFYSCLYVGKQQLNTSKSRVGWLGGECIGLVFLDSKCYIHNPNGCIRHSYWTGNVERWSCAKRTFGWFISAIFLSHPETQDQKVL